MELKRKITRMHVSHAGSWIFQVLLFSGFVVAAATYVTHPMAAVVIVVSAYFLYRAVIQAIEGHLKIAKYHKAKRYWLQNESQAFNVVSVEVADSLENDDELKKAG